MAAIRRRDTRPELALRSALHASGYRFRVDYRLDLVGAKVRPDVVFTRDRVAVFVDGCFFHRCPEHGVLPQTNAEFWLSKLNRNVERDREQDDALQRAGWSAIRVWEHETLDAALVKVSQAVSKARASRLDPP